MDRDEDGRYTESRTDREVLDAVDANAPAATSAVADELKLTRQAADYRLRQLREAGRVESKKIGSALAWYLPDDTREREPGPAAAPAEPPDTSTAADTEAAAGPDDTDDRRSLDVRIRALDVPGSGSRLDARVAAAVRLVEYLEAEGEATADELKALLDADEVGYASVESYWANFIRGPGVLKAIEEVEAPGKGGKVYRYRRDRPS